MRRRRRPEALTARQLALEILLRVEQAGAWASVLLQGAEGRFDDPRESALAHQLVLGVLRQRDRLDHALRALGTRPFETLDAEVRGTLRLGAYSIAELDRVPHFAAVDSAVELVRWAGRPAAAGFVNAVLRRLAADAGSYLPAPPVAGNVAGLALYRSHPHWWVERLVARQGFAAADRLLAAHNTPAPTVLRCNVRRGNTDRVRRLLAEEGIEARPGRFAPDSLRLAGGHVGRTRVLREGLAWVQDEASQLAGAMFGDFRGQRVLDLCAAPGTKTLQLALAARPGALIVATDRHGPRLGRVAAAFAVQGLPCPGLVVGDMSAPGLPLRGPFDQILVDAPCSGTGTLRRRPEIRWRLAAKDIEVLGERQGRLLERAASLLTRGGRLVYSVCSLEPEEGAGVVTRFLGHHPDFRVVDPRPELVAAARTWVGAEGYLRTDPAEADLDGFFAATLMRL